MWTRRELKTRAKECLRRYYWPAFVVSLLLVLVSSGLSLRAGGNSIGAGTEGAAYSGSMMPEDILEYAAGIPIPRTSRGLTLVMGMLTGMALLVTAAKVLLSIFVAPVFTVGSARFYMESRQQEDSAGVGRILWGFSGAYLKIVGTMFVKELLIFAVEMAGALVAALPALIYFLSSPDRLVISLLTLGAPFIITAVIGSTIVGVYLSYCYQLVPYILSEAPGLGTMEILRLSKRMMRGQKWKTFLLELSFFGWLFLGVLCCGVGVLFVLPYLNATMAELYAVLREPYLDELSAGWV